MAIEDSPYDRELIEKADRLYVGKMSLRDVARHLDGVPYSSVYSWADRDYISKNTNGYENGPEYKYEKMAEVERLLQKYPPEIVEEKTGVPRTTQRSWRRKGWIDYESWHNRTHEANV